MALKPRCEQLIENIDGSPPRWCFPKLQTLWVFITLIIPLPQCTLVSNQNCLFSVSDTAQPVLWLSSPVYSSMQLHFKALRLQCRASPAAKILNKKEKAPRDHWSVCLLTLPEDWSRLRDLVWLSVSWYSWARGSCVFLSIALGLFRAPIVTDAWPLSTASLMAITAACTKEKKTKHGFSGGYHISDQITPFTSVKNNWVVKRSQG